jgi:aminoglycoside phosphotransferase (APT) family kinase protein
MESISKIHLSSDIGREIAAAHFGSGAGLRNFTELKEGYYNAAALLELDDGLKLVLKAAPPDTLHVLRYEKDIMRAEVEVMRLVRAQTTVPCPRIYAYDTSRRLLESDYFLMEYLPGTPFHRLRHELPASEQARIERTMGRMARQISTIRGPAFGYFAQPEPPGTGWKTTFGNMLRGLLLDGWEASVSLPLPYEALMGRLEAHFDALDGVETPRLVHWDLWEGNVLVDPATRKVSGLIDYERALWGDPLMEYIFHNLDPNSSFLQGYGTPLLKTPEQRLRRLLYNAYFFLVLIIECPFRQYETNDQENWARPKLAEVLEVLNNF